ncbi:MAG TPA: DUF1214 domain-containing protein [Vitreimonas sp.]|nr:DUF1214 domain-containing protein [Vitreimonas sp.]
MLRQIVAWVVTVLIGVTLGVISLWAVFAFGTANFSEHYGAWSLNRAAGSQAAGPYTRAIIARSGLLALSAREAIYFNLDRDEHGRPLDEGCVYELSGAPLETRWWSVTLYASDNFLARNSDHAHSIDASRVGPGAWRARVAPVQGDAPFWISSRAAGRGFSLTLRVYNPYDDFAPSAEALPHLRAISCAGGQA